MTCNWLFSFGCLWRILQNLLVLEFKKEQCTCILRVRSLYIKALVNSSCFFESQPKTALDIVFKFHRLFLTFASLERFLLDKHICWAFRQIFLANMFIDWSYDIHTACSPQVKNGLCRSVINFTFQFLLKVMSLCVMISRFSVVKYVHRRKFVQESNQLFTLKVCHSVEMSSILVYP